MREDLVPTLALIERLTAEPLLREYEASLIVWQVLKAAGYAVSDPTQSGRDSPIDLHFTGLLNGVSEKVGVEIKAHRGHVSGQTIYKALDARTAGGFDRMLVIALGQFSPLALDRGSSDRLGKVDLLTPAGSTRLGYAPRAGDASVSKREHHHAQRDARDSASVGACSRGVGRRCLVGSGADAA